MRRLFGRKKEVPQGPSLQETSEQLGAKSSHMDKEINEINVKLAKITRDMKNPANKGRQAALKRQAMMLLKRRKMLEAHQNTLEGQRFNLDQISFTQDQIQTTIQTANTMKSTAQTMKKQMKQISIEGVEDTMFDMEDMLEDANEISGLLAGGIGEQYDEGDLEAELDGLMEGDDFSLEGLEGDTEATTSAEAETEPPTITF
ncbi:Charged multivesicular body protein 5 [Histomonas meleagridis]|uniref:Charged multivesicular body protein 5 n=1 Tax=Histomonas meleagridis TaxID=135588 RepID=UPI003559D948|nr:Charged multivesicular body protein 5 [Histomonas meleagridis]KAH0802620.1 Charged multivesicular body protein 5 [Histomonas meleagridis]